MAVNTQFVTTEVGTWISLIEQRPERTALLVQLLGGRSVLAINKAGPNVTNQYGTMPCGIWHSLDTGNGPATFRLSELADGDLVKQEWFAYLVEAPAPMQGTLTELDENDNDTGTGGPPCTFPLSFTAQAGLMIAIVGSTLDAASAPTVTSTLAGTLTQATIATTPVNMLNQGSIQAFVWMHPGGSDTLQVASAAGGLIQLSLCQVISGIALDVTATAVGNANPVTITAAGPTTATNTIAVAAFVSFCPQISTDDWVAPWTFVGGFNHFNGPGDEWACQFAWAPFSAITTITASDSPPLGTGDWGMILVAVTMPSEATEATFTVIESYRVPALDDPDYEDPTATITAELPRLSEGGVAALQNLLAKINGTEDDQDEAQDES